MSDEMHPTLPIPSIVAQDEAPLILVGAREEIPCHVYAVHVLAVAIEARKRWIRVDKQGHRCEYDVNQLVAYWEGRAAYIPRAIIYTKQEHASVGNWSDEGRPLWPGLDLHALERAGMGHPHPQVLDGERSP